MDTRRLHEVIKELRAELERVNVAIRQIEVIAKTVSKEQETEHDCHPSEHPQAERSANED